ncbi:MAG: transporter substrate-binding domain-containing protein [Eubacterium sp.]|nr:transporter substrate-binding domain-containing protein [Eubacterium sp.]
MADRKKTIRATVCVFILSLFFTGLAAPVSYADESVPQLTNQKNTVRVGYFENEIFQEGAEEGAVRQGYAYDYYCKLSEYTGWNYDYVYGSFADLYQMLLDGEVDLLAGLAKTDERTSIIGYPESAMGNETYNMIKHASDESITNSYETLSGKNIGVLDSAMVGVLNKFLTEHDLTANVKKYPDQQRLLDDFDAMKVDVIVSESDGTHERENSELLYAFGTSDYYLCVNIKRPDLLKELNSAQAQLAVEEPNYIHSLQIKYYSQSISSRTLSSVEKEWVKEHNAITVGYLNNYLPYSDTDEDGSVKGLIRDFFPSVIDALGIKDMKINYVGYDNYDDMVSDVQKGTVDVIFPVGGGLYFSEENGIYQSTAVVSSTTELVYSGEYNEEKTKTFAINENNRMQYFYTKTHYPDAEFKYYTTIEECLEAVMNGEVGCTTLNGIRANDILKNRSYHSLSMKPMNDNDDRCFGVCIGNEGLLKLLNRGVSLVGTDQAQSIAYRYVNDLYTYSFFDFVFDHVWIVILILLALATLIVFFTARESRRSKRAANEKAVAAEILAEKNTELAHAVSVAEDANKAKTYFLSTMSHDIRTPMNSILSMNEMILRECEDDDILMYAGHIRSSGNTLLGLINDILDFSKMEAGKLDIIPVNYEMSSVLNDLVNMVQTRAEEKGLHLSLDVDSDIPNYLYGDEIRIKQAVTNLLTNAVKYTNEGSVFFTVGFEKCPDEEDAVFLKVSVRDTGVGIPEEDINTLFMAFERSDEADARNIEGTGLGLTITQCLLRMMDSTLNVESVVGRGSTFSFSVKQKVVDWVVVGDYETAFRRSMAERKRYREKFTAPEACLLIVDDTPANLVVIRNLLKRTQLKIDTADSADGCIDLATKKKYDIIFLDHMMPYKDGIEALKELKALEDNPNQDTPTICLTANAISGMRDTYLAAGFDDYLTKPIDPDRLEDAIIRYLPDDKVQPASDQEDEEDVTLPAGLDQIEGIDINAGLEHCGSVAAYLDAIEAYLETVRINVDEITDYRSKQDLENTTVRIHGMKSTARVIGALSLSKFAEELEEAGKAKDADTIEKNIDRFLADYQALGEALEAVMRKDTAGEDDRPMLSEEELTTYYDRIRALCDSADYDEIETIGEHLKAYQIPEKEKERVDRVIEAISMLDFDDLDEIL